LEVLQKAFPEKQSKWYESIYENISVFVKYIGIPGLIIAALVPLYNLTNTALEYRNKSFVRDIYVNIYPISHVRVNWIDLKR